MPSGVCNRAKQPLCLGELLARTAVLHLPCRARELPRPAGEDLVRGVCLPFAHGPQQNPYARGSVLLPRQRLADQGDEVIEVGSLDRRCDAIGQSRHAKAPVRVLGRADSEECFEGALAGAALGEFPGELGALVEADLPTGNSGPEALLFVVEKFRIDPLPFALDHREPADDVRCHRDEPWRGRQPPPCATLLPPPRCRSDPGAFAVEVRVEQGVERDHPIVVCRAFGDEVDDDACFLARVHPHDPADALLVDAARGGRREVEADGCAGRVPPFGEQLSVDEDVDLATLVGGKCLGELDRRRLARDRLRLDACGAELLREVVGVLHAGGVDDAGRRAEAFAVEAGRSLVQGRVVECCGERALFEVAADDWYGVDRGSGGNSQAAQRRDEPAARGIGEREVVNGGGEDVRHLLRDQLLRRGHADIDGLAERADRRARLLAEGRVSLVANHELIGGAGDLARVPREPGIGLDRDRVVAERFLACIDRIGEAVGIALGREVPLELRDEQAPVGENEDPEVTGRLDETCRCDRLARSRRVPEAIAARRARIFAGEGRLVEHHVVVDHTRVEVVILFVELGWIGVGHLSGMAIAIAVPVLVRRALVRGDQFGQHPRQRIDLVAPQVGAGRRPRRGGGEHALEPEHQPEANAPAARRSLLAGFHLGECIVKCAAPGGAGRKGNGRVFTGVQERLAVPGLSAKRGGCQAFCRLRRRMCRDGIGLVHMRSTRLECCFP